MTASVLPTFADAPASPAAITLPRPNLFRAWISSFLIYLTPRRTGELWVRVSVLRALLVAAANVLILPLWLLLIGTCVYLYYGHGLRDANYLGALLPNAGDIFVQTLTAAPEQVLKFLGDLPLLGVISLAVTLSTLFLVGLGILYFVLLPFGARPGANRACVQHVLRTVLLSTGAFHILGPLFSLTFLYFIFRKYPDGADALQYVVGPLAWVIVATSVWMLTCLVIAARRDYRTAVTMPKPHDPWCEECGYNLVAASPDGRCPECGTPVVESLGPDTRQPTAWERHPSPFQFATIGRQIRQLIVSPRELFFSMPTLSGQRAAQRWLIASALLIGLAATLILPTYNLLLLHGTDRMDWSMDFLGGSLFIGLVWATLALMMVGIETAGIATFSRMKAKSDPDFGGPGSREGVYLATSAKVTAYSSILMLLWVFLGGAQILAAQYWTVHRLYHVWHVHPRTEQILLAFSLSAAHIAGLLWYEITVYRGIRGIQYANK